MSQEAADRVKTLVQLATEGLLCGTGSDDVDNHMGVPTEMERGDVEAAQKLAEAWQNSQQTAQSGDAHHGAQPNSCHFCGCVYVHTCVCVLDVSDQTTS